MALIPGLSGIDWMPFLGQTMYWVGYGLLTILVLGVMYYAYNLTSYKIKATVLEVYGNGEENPYAFTKIKNNSVRWVEHKTLWQPLKPLFNKIRLQPFPDNFIYAGNRIIVSEINGKWIPINVDLNNINGMTFKPMPSFWRNWEITAHAKIDMELQSEDWWSKNKQLFIMMICGVCCLIACCVTIYLAYKFMGPNTTAMKGFTEAINNLVNVGGAAPK